MARDPSSSQPLAKPRTQAEGHAAIVLCGSDAAALGLAAQELVSRGRRVAVWLGEPDADAIIEMVDELFLSDGNTPLR